MVEASDFESLVKENYKPMLNTVYKYTKDWDDAEDCAQQAVTNAWLKIHTFRGDCQFLTWLTRIGINEAYKLIAKNRRRPPREDVSVESVDEHFPSNIFDHDTPESLTSLYQSQEAVEVALSKMPSEQADALTLREQEGLTYDEIAETMGTPVGTVQSRISRARKHIRDYLQEQENGLH